MIGKVSDGRGLLGGCGGTPPPPLARLWHRSFAGRGGGRAGDLVFRGGGKKTLGFGRGDLAPPGPHKNHGGENDFTPEKQTKQKQPDGWEGKRRVFTGHTFCFGGGPGGGGGEEIRGGGGGPRLGKGRGMRPPSWGGNNQIKSSEFHWGPPPTHTHGRGGNPNRENPSTDSALFHPSGPHHGVFSIPPPHVVPPVAKGC